MHLCGLLKAFISSLADPDNIRRYSCQHAIASAFRLYSFIRSATSYNRIAEALHKPFGYLLTEVVAVSLIVRRTFDLCMRQLDDSSWKSKVKNPFPEVREMWERIAWDVLAVWHENVKCEASFLAAGLVADEARSFHPTFGTAISLSELLGSPPAPVRQVWQHSWFANPVPPQHFSIRVEQPYHELQDLDRVLVELNLSQSPPAQSSSLVDALLYIVLSSLFLLYVADGSIDHLFAEHDNVAVSNIAPSLMAAWKGSNGLNPLTQPPSTAKLAVNAGIETSSPSAATTRAADEADTPGVPEPQDTNTTDVDMFDDLLDNDSAATRNPAGTADGEDMDVDRWPEPLSAASQSVQNKSLDVLSMPSHSIRVAAAQHDEAAAGGAKPTEERPSGSGPESQNVPPQKENDKDRKRSASPGESDAKRRKIAFDIGSYGDLQSSPASSPLTSQCRGNRGS